MNHQEIFNKVARHLLTQNRRCGPKPGEKELPACLYRNSEGLSCAVGCLIPDDQYDPSLEGLQMRSINSDPRGTKMRSILEGVGVSLDTQWKLLQTLQRIHDYQNPAFWKGCLANVAKNYSLTTEVLDATYPSNQG